MMEEIKYGDNVDSVKAHFHSRYTEVFGMTISNNILNFMDFLVICAESDFIDQMNIFQQKTIHF